MKEQLPTTASYIAGFFSTFFGVISLNDAAIIIGIILSVSTFAVNWFYRRKTYLLNKSNRGLK